MTLVIRTLDELLAYFESEARQAAKEAASARYDALAPKRRVIKWDERATTWERAADAVRLLQQTEEETDECPTAQTSND